MRTAVAAALALALSACRGQPTPRDYQNNPPAMTHPVSSSAQAPTAQGMPGPKPEPSTGAEGKTTQPVTQTSSTTLPDQAPTTTTH
ncbi:MAG TPA: hypothetical protein VGR02_00580 [Thermoanaerobaculia bacterium]|jgi:hypothetical protein|nr:hypothetical protein [Thermoanaerobaculia bacterium]